MPNLTFQSPGITTIEQPSAIRQIQGVATNISGMVVLADRGPIGVPTLITSMTDYIRVFGGPYTGGIGYWAAKGYFENAGNDVPLYITRTAHYTTLTDKDTLTAVKASVTLQDQDGTPDDTLLVEAASEGKWGNLLQVSIENASRFSTTINQTGGLTNGATSIILDSVAGIEVGTVLFFDDGTDSITKVVTDVQGSTVYFSAVSGLSDEVADGGTVTEVSFHLIVSEAGTEIERHEYLSMEDTNKTDYVETRINTLADFNLSVIRVTDLDTSTTDNSDQRPDTAYTLEYLTDGADGISGLASGDLLGDSGEQTGMYSFDQIQVLNQLAIPESQASVVQQGLVTYCENRKYTFAVLNSPLGLTPAQAITYVEDTAAFNTKHAAFYYPQVKVYDADNDRNITVPADGHIMGKYVRVDATAGVATVAAGENGLLSGIVGFENRETEKKAVRDTLYPKRVNCLGNISGFGLCIYGSRTLDRTGDMPQINQRRTFNFVEQSLNDGMGFVLFKNNTAEFRRDVKRTMDSFLATLVPDILESFFTDTGDGLNNALVRAQNKLVASVAIKVPDTIEHFFILVSKDTRAQEAALQQLVGG